MSVVIGIAGEDNGHFLAVTTLVDATLLESCNWLDGILETSRSWRGVNDGEVWYKYDPEDAHNLLPIELNGVSIKPQGHIRGEPLKPEASMWRKVLMLFHRANPRPEIVILARDMDANPERRSGMEQVRDGIDWPFQVVIAAALPEVEAWLVSGFVPEKEKPQEIERLAKARRDLSFDPTTQSEKLTSRPNDVITDSKRVLTRLCGDVYDRRAECLADRELLKSRGSGNGVAAFLGEVETRIVPVFGGSR